MKRVICIFLSLLLILPILSSCAGQAGQDDSPLTMFVGLGATNSSYYPQLHELIYEKTGIDVQFIYQNTSDVSNAVKVRAANNDLPADIVITATSTEAEIQKSAYLDLAKYTNIPDLYTVTTVRAAAVDGAVYQLPFAARLIGIEYNATLFEELGWELPSTYQDMVELKAKADAAGIKFAVSGGIATGHGFSYLFNVMGTQFINTPDGSEWLAGFLDGTADITAFADEIDYFEKYNEAGLFGSFHDSDWNAYSEFSRERALFYYNTVNDISSYDGFRYTSDGRLYGAEYTSDGVLKVEAASDGIAVCVGGSYVLYDPENEAHQGLERVNIPGAVVLHDKYASMPWISENGESNCYAVYNHMYLSLDKKLGEKNRSKKLNQAVKVLEVLSSAEAAELYDNLFSDAYIPISGIENSENSMYAGYSSAVSAGYLMDWYYNRFDSDSIVFTGEKVNALIKGTEGVTVQTVLDELALRNEKYIGDDKVVMAWFEDTLSYADSAKLLCIANGLSLQKALTDAGLDLQISAALLPYTGSLAELPLYYVTPVVQEHFYAGNFEEARIKTTITAGCSNPLAITMTGSTLRQLSENGFAYTDREGKKYSFSYCLVMRGNEKIDDSALYTVAVPQKCLSEELFAEFEGSGSIAQKEGAYVKGDSETGIRMYAAANRVITAAGLSWGEN